MNEDSYSMSRAEREWQHRHEILLQAATELFVEHGVAGTTMQMVADHAEFSVGYLYKHFGSKQNVLDEILSHQLQMYDTIRNDIRTDGNRSPLNRYRAEIQIMAKHLAKHPGLVQVLVHPTPEQPAWVRREMERHRREDVDLVREAQAGGELPAGDPELLAAALDGAVWAMLQTLNLPNRADDVERIPEYVEQYVLRPMMRADLSSIRKDTADS